MVKYRDHKGSLDASMETVQDVSSMEEIRAHLNNYYTRFGKCVDEIRFVHIGMDNRIGWDTYRVLQRLKGESNFTVAGFADGKLE